MNAQTLVNSAVQNWLASHPTISWIVDHPLWTVGLALLAIFLFWGLLNAIARFTEQFWVALLRSPLALSHWLLSRSPKVVARMLQVKPREDPQQQLAEALARLEELRKEEDQLIAQVKELLASQSKVLRS